MPSELSYYNLSVIDDFSSAADGLSHTPQPTLLLLNPKLSHAVGVKMFAHICDELRQQVPEQEFVSAYAAHDNVGKIMIGATTCIDIFFLNSTVASYPELSDLLQSHGKLLFSSEQLAELS